MSFAISLREWWQWSYAQVCTFLYFHRVSRTSGPEIPEGPVLFLGTHRNGILDALIYSNVLGRMTFVMAKRLHKTIFGRLFFGGIGVVRDKDVGDKDGGETNQNGKSGNRQALKQCRKYLLHGRRIFMFPEGSSSLGPRLLDIKPGAARIVLSALRVRPDLKVVPVSVTYERAWGFRSRAEVQIGKALDLSDVMLHPKAEQFPLVHKRICNSLHALACEFETEAEQEAFEVAGNIRRLVEEKAGPHDRTGQGLEADWQSLKKIANDTGARRYNRVPLLLEGSAGQHLLKVIALGPFVTFMAVANAPVLLGARLVGKKVADSPNVISLYRLLAGLPLMLLWGAMTFCGLFVLELTELWALSLSLSLIGLGSYDTVMRSWTLLRNRRKGNSFREAFEAFARSASAVPLPS